MTAHHDGRLDSRSRRVSENAGRAVTMIDLTRWITEG